MADIQFDGWEARLVESLGDHRFASFDAEAWMVRPQDDPDGDGFTNIEEYANKTLPLKMTGVMDEVDGLPTACIKTPLYQAQQ